MKSVRNYFVILSSAILMTSCSKQVESTEGQLSNEIQKITKGNPNVQITTVQAASAQFPNAALEAKKMTIEEFRALYTKMESLKNQFNHQNDSIKVKLLGNEEPKIKANSEGNEGPDDGGPVVPGIITPGGATTYFSRFPFSSPGGGMGVYLYYNLNAARQVINPNMMLYGFGFDIWQPLFTSNGGYNPRTGVTTFSLTGALISNIGNILIVVIYTYDFSVNAYTMISRIDAIR